MRLVRDAVLVAGLVFSAVAAAADFDGTVSLTCTPSAGLDCPADKGKCGKFERDPDAKGPPYVRIDFANKTVKTPNLTIPLPIQNSATNDEQLILQGTDSKYAWSAIVNRQGGGLTIAIAARKGAYVFFGKCKADSG